MKTRKLVTNPQIPSTLSRVNRTTSPAALPAPRMGLSRLLAVAGETPRNPTSSPVSGLVLEVSGAVSRSRSPSLCTVTTTSWLGLSLRTSVRSPHSSMGIALTATKRSPTRMPASIAAVGEPSSVSATTCAMSSRGRSLSGSPTTTLANQSSANAMTKWVPIPPMTTTDFCQKGLTLYARASSSGGTSSRMFMPTIRTNPPAGIALDSVLSLPALEGPEGGAEPQEILGGLHAKELGRYQVAAFMDHQDDRKTDYHHEPA